MKIKTAFITLLFLAALAGSQVKAQSVDYNILCALQQSRTPTLDRMMVWTSNSLVLAPSVPAGLLIGGLIADNQTLVGIGTATGVSFLTAAVVTEAVKFAVHRPRPYITYTDDLVPVKTTVGYSFPSGHTSLTFAVATSLSLSSKKWYVATPSMLCAAGVAFSRLYLGVHYPSDVLTGMAVGILSGFAGYWLSREICDDAGIPPAKMLTPTIVLKF